MYITIGALALGVALGRWMMTREQRCYRAGLDDSKAQVADERQRADRAYAAANRALIAANSAREEANRWRRIASTQSAYENGLRAGRQLDYIAQADAQLKRGRMTLLAARTDKQGDSAYGHYN